MSVLPELTRSVLAPFFPDLRLENEVFEIERWPLHVPKAKNLGYAGRKRIFIKRERWDPYTSRGIGLIAHELFHRRQRRAMGDIAFELAWLAGYVRAGFDAGERNTVEAPAYAFEREIRRRIDDAYTAGDIRNGPKTRV
jgi:hypothetical protein